MGGNLIYEYLGDTDSDGDYNYNIIFKTYINCNSPFWGGAFPEPSLSVGIYEGVATPTGSLPLITAITMPLTDSIKIELNLPDTCAVGDTVCIYEVVYELEVDLPLTFSGYHLYYSRCCRNWDIINVFDPGTQGMIFHAYIPPSLVNNSAPVFSDLPVPFLCVGDTQSIINTAFDVDGDQLIFSFVHPYDNLSNNPDPLPFPLPLITYNPGYDKNTPFGTGGYAYINGATGYSEYVSPNTGQYVVAVEIREFRNSQLIGITRRDMQLQIINCPFNPAPGLSNTNGSGQTQYAIDEGDSLCFPIIFTDQFGDSLIMEIVSPIFDTALTNPAATIQNPVVGDSVVQSDFCWNTACGQGQSIPYLFTVSVRDNGCPPKTKDIVYEITVNPFDGPAAITGVTSVCPFEAGLTYSVPLITGATYDWAITGGTQVSGGNTESIVVDWDSTGLGIVQVTTTSYLGCIDGPITLNVTVNPYPATDAGPDQFMCSADTTQLGTATTINYDYLWNPSTGMDDATISDPLIILSNTSSTNDTIFYVVTTTDNLTSCIMTDTVMVVVSPAPFADAGTDVSFCSGDVVAIGSAALPGYTYMWMPGTGLSDSTVADPTITLINLTTSPDTFEYIVTATDTAPNCYTRDTIQVIVRPYPIPNAGSDQSFCSGASVTLGTTATSGYTYQWTPSNGLSSDTLSDPVLTLINTDTIIDTIEYVVATTVFGCTINDSAMVYVHPTPLVDAGPDRYLCSGDSDTIGTQGFGGYSYNWTPTTGLSDSTIATPVVTLTNPFIPNDTSIYTVVVTTGFGCQDSDNVEVVVNHLPVSDAGVDRAFCSGDTVDLGAPPVGGYLYVWSPFNGISNVSSSEPWLTLINADTIIDTITYVVTTTVGSCSTTDSVEVLVHPSPIVDAGPDRYICSGDTVTIGTAALGSYGYLWTPSAGLSDSTAADPDVSLTNPALANDTTEYIVLVTTTFGCSDMDSTLVIVNHLPPSNAGNDTAFCSRDTVDLGAPTTVGYSYAWLPIAGVSDITISDPQLTLINTDTIIDTILYYVTTTVGLCSTMDSVEVIVHPTPIVDAGPDVYMCSGDADTIGSITLGGYSYLWNPSFGLTDPTVSNPVVSLTNPGIPNDTTEFIVTVTTGFGCIDGDSVLVIVNHLPVSEAGNDVTFCSGNSDSLGTDSTVGYTYLWFPGTGLSDSTAADPSITLLNADTIADSIMYYVTTTVDSCSTVDSVRVIVLPLPQLNAGADTGFCSGDTIAIGSPPRTDYTYSWSPVTGLSDTTISDPTVTLLNGDTLIDTTYYVLTAVDTISNCVSSDTVRILAYPLPRTPDILGSISICPGADSLVYYVNGDAGSTFDWSLTGAGSIIFGQGSDSILVNWDTTTIWQIITIETDSNTCLGDTSAIDGSTNPDLEPPVPTGPDTLCGNSINGVIYTTPFANGSVYDWYISGGTINSGNGTNAVNVDWDSLGTGYIWYDETSTTIDTVCTGTSDSLAVQVFTVPVGVPIMGDFVICQYDTASEYSMAGFPASNYTWIVGSDTIGDGIGLDSLFIAWDSAGTFVLSIVETAPGNCVNTVSDTVTVYVKPVVDSIVGDTAICFDINDTYNYHINGFPGSTYQWTIVGGTIVSLPLDNDTVTIRWDSVVNGNISVIETSADTCAGVVVLLNVYVYPMPADSTIDGSFTFCEDSLSFMYSINGLPGSSFIWLLDTDTVASGVGADTINLVWDSAGTYIITLIENTINSCSDTLAETVTVYAKPITSILSGDTAICFDTADTYLYYVSGFSGSTYDWTVVGGTIVDTAQLQNDSVIVSWDSVVSGTISVVETSADSCAGDTVRLDVSVFQPPVDSTIDGGFVFCEDTLAFSYTFTALPGSDITWTLDGDTILAGVDEDTVTIIWDTAGTYALMVVEVTANNCSDTLTDSITVFPKPIIDSIFGDTVICHDTSDTVLYYVNGFGGSSYAWSIGNGTFISLSLDNDSILVMWDTLGMGDLTVVEISQDSCWGDTVRLNIMLNEIPSADSILGMFEMCQYTSGETYSVIGLSGSSYIWNVPGSTNIIDDSSSSITVDWDSAGSFILTVVEISAEGCVGDTLDSIVVINPFPQTMLLTGDTNVCPPNNLGEIYTVLGYDSSTYVWTVNGGVIDTGQGTNSILVDWDTTGMGSVSVVEITNDSCVGDTIGWPEIILDSPGITMRVVSDGELEDTEVEIKWDMFNSIGFPDTITLLRRLNFTSNMWTIEAMVDASDLVYVDDGRLTSDYSFEYQIVGLNACLDTVASRIHNTVLLNGTNEESDNTVDLIWNRYWDWDNGVDHYEIWRKLDDEPYFTFYEDAGIDTSYRLTTGADGFFHCYRILAVENGGNSEESWSNEICLEFLHLLDIPTVISPNGNGLNDVWKIGNIEYYPAVTVEIFNRWGQRLYYSVGYPELWDGTYNGKELPVGVYYYIIDIKREGIEPYTGSISILHRE